MYVEDVIYINLNSQHADLAPTTTSYKKSYISNVFFNFTNILHESDDIQFSHIDIANAQIPLSFYNLNYTNTTLKYSFANGIKTLSIPVSNYSMSTLIIALVTQFNTGGYTMSISVDKPSGKFTFTSNQDFVFYSSGTTIFDILGFDMYTDYTSSNSILVADNPYTLISIKKLKICSSVLSTNSLGSSKNGSSSTSLIGTIPVSGQPFSVIQYNNSSGRKSILKNKMITGIDIQIYDENNRYINFNNVEWAMTLALTITRKIQEKDTVKFQDVVTPIGEVNHNPLANDIYNEDTDLDFWMYQHGVNF